MDASDHKRRDTCEVFGDVACKVDIPGVVINSGLMGGRFYFQPLISFRSYNGLKVEQLGRYSFPEGFQVDDPSVCIELNPVRREPGLRGPGHAETSASTATRRSPTRAPSAPLAPSADSPN